MHMFISESCACIIFSDFDYLCVCSLCSYLHIYAPVSVYVCLHINNAASKMLLTPRHGGTFISTAAAVVSDRRDVYSFRYIRWSVAYSYDCLSVD